MNIAFAVWLLIAPISEASNSVHLEAGTWPAGVLFSAASRAAERPVYPESPTIGNTPVFLERDLLVSRGNLPAILSLLFDAKIALVELTPGEPRDGWIATTRTIGAERPIKIRVRVIPLEFADPAEIALLLNCQAEVREAQLPPGDTMTRFVADPRTGSLIARYTSVTRLRDYLEMMNEVDKPAPAGTRTPVLRTYRPDWALAQDLKVLFEAEWKKIGGQTIRVVAPDAQNMLLIRCPIQTWEVVEELLRKIDREQIP